MQYLHITTDNSLLKCKMFILIPFEDDHFSMNFFRVRERKFFIISKRICENENSKLNAQFYF